MTLVSSYLHHLRSNGISEDTLDTYYYHLIAFTTWAKERQYRIQTIELQHMIEFYHCLLEQGKAKRTINAIFSCVRKLYDYLIYIGELQLNPVCRTLKVPIDPNEPTPLTDHELAQLLQFTETLPPNIRAAYHCLLVSGGRLKEVASLTRDDFELVNGHLFVHYRTGNTVRKVPSVDATLAKELAAYIEAAPTDGPVFRTTKRNIQRYADIFTEQTNNDFNCQRLRYTCAVLLAKKGFSVTKVHQLLGYKTMRLAPLLAPYEKHTPDDFEQFNL